MLAVIGAGLPRTGTTSLKAALDRLGLGPCHHMQEVAAHPAQVEGWLGILQGRVDWNDLLLGYRSAVDWPSAHFWRPLALACPDAKIVLTVRDPRDWYASMRDTVYALLHDPASAPASFQPVVSGLRPLIDRIWADTFGTTLDEPMPAKLQAIEAFERHTGRVVEALPADRVLVFESGQGWEPLCGFLGVAVPDQPYPHLNDRQGARDRLRREAGA